MAVDFTVSEIKSETNIFEKQDPKLNRRGKLLMHTKKERHKYDSTTTLRKENETSTTLGPT